MAARTQRVHAEERRFDAIKPGVFWKNKKIEKGG